MAVNCGNKMVRNCPFFCLALRAQRFRRQRPGSGREKQEGPEEIVDRSSRRLFVFSEGCVVCNQPDYSSSVKICKCC